jgi:hypothetical protein
MMSKLVKFAAAAGAVAFAAWAGNAYALEGNSPFLPTVTVGIPIGALPPAGFYASDDNVIITGAFKNNSGNSTGANVNTYLNIPSVLWVPGWSFLGATYGAAIIQPYAMQSLNFSGLLGRGPAEGPAGSQSTSSGLFNTIISPLNLSWNVHPLFFKVGFSVYINDGDSVHGSGSGLSAPANNFWTFEPDFAITYLENGWNFTGHFVFDFNTNDTLTNYQSGDVFYLDWTASKAVGKWTWGIGGNFTQQFTCDTGSGDLSGCNEIQHVDLGPLMGYNFGPAEINLKAMFGLKAENTANASFYHLGVSFPF